MKVSVSILKEKDNLKDAFNRLEKSKTNYIHLDIMDGSFTNNKSFTINDVIDLKTSKELDVHIMSKNLDKEINDAVKLKPSIITFHYEATKDILKYIKLIKDNNIKVGLAINPKTRVWKIRKYLKYIDLVLVMSVNPGMGGQDFIKSSIRKVKKLSKKKYNYLVSIDGGINAKTINYVKNYIDIAVSGSYILDSDDIDKKIEVLKK
ncbi:MAG: ribulose-phosphate 3-epimerase [Bacilli bacterium]|nr:ribulose-phosphate 3-epimerase [Bacilli bacterium]